MESLKVLKKHQALITGGPDGEGLVLQFLDGLQILARSGNRLAEERLAEIFGIAFWNLLGIADGKPEEFAALAEQVAMLVDRLNSEATRCAEELRPHAEKMGAWPVTVNARHKLARKDQRARERKSCWQLAWETTTSLGVGMRSLAAMSATPGKLSGDLFDWLKHRVELERHRSRDEEEMRRLGASEEDIREAFLPPLPPLTQESAAIWAEAFVEVSESGEESRANLWVKRQGKASVVAEATKKLAEWAREIQKT